MTFVVITKSVNNVVHTLNGNCETVVVDFSAMILIN